MQVSPAPVCTRIYDAIGNRTKRENVQADAAGKSLSETYAYDSSVGSICTRIMRASIYTLATNSGSRGD